MRGKRSGRARPQVRGVAFGEHRGDLDEAAVGVLSRLGQQVHDGLGGRSLRSGLHGLLHHGVDVGQPLPEGLAEGGAVQADDDKEVGDRARAAEPQGHGLCEAPLNTSEASHEKGGLQQRDARSHKKTQKVKGFQTELDTLCPLYHTNTEIYSYEGCEYIVVGHGESRWGTHKGNCKNPIHNK